MITVKIEGLDKLAENLYKDAQKKIIDEARRAGVTAKFVGNNKVEFSGSEDSVRKYLKQNPSIRANPIVKTVPTIKTTPTVKTKLTI
jgi:hypothetical protein